AQVQRRTAAYATYSTRAPGSPRNGRAEYLQTGVRRSPRPVARSLAVQSDALAIVGHEVGNLIATFVGFSELLLSQDRSRTGGLCRQIVEAHGGRIWAESDGLGQGTRVCFGLPIAIVERSLATTASACSRLSSLSEHVPEHQRNARHARGLP